MNFLMIIGTGAVLTLSAVSCFGQDSSGVKIIPNGHASMEAGQIVKGFDKNAGDIKNVVVERIHFGAGFNKT